ncbi:MAG: T9SS type A sorting domain-containing protein [Bacteroidales bacterium]
MKRIFFILLFILFNSSLVFSQHDQFYRINQSLEANNNIWFEPDTIIYYNFFNDTIFRRRTRVSPENKVTFYFDDVYYDSSWEMYSRTTLQYNNEDKLYYYLEELNIDGEIINDVTDSIYYFENKTIHINKLWEVDHWINNRKYIVNTNSSDDPISKYEYFWEVNNKEWEEYYKDTCIYNEDNLLMENIVKTKFFNEDILYKYSYTYDDNFKLISKLYQVFDSTDFSWKNDSLFVYTYNLQGNNDTIYTKFYDNDIWVDTIINSFTYFDDNKIKSEKHTVVNSNGQHDDIYSIYFDYDVNGNIILKQKEFHNVISNEKQEWFFDENNNCIKSTTSKLQDGEWIPTYKIGGIELYYNNMESEMLLQYIKCYSLSWVTATYKEIENLTNIETSNKKTFQCYPNPTHDLLFIKTDNENYNKIEIYNINGSLNYSGKINNSIDLSNFKKGLYFLRLDGEKKSEVQKVIKN